jgi:hypothetical protein
VRILRLVVGALALALSTLPASPALGATLSCVGGHPTPCTYYDPGVLPTFQLVLAEGDLASSYTITANGQEITSGSIFLPGTYDVTAPLPSLFEGTVVITLSSLGSSTLEVVASVDYTPPPAPIVHAPLGFVADRRPAVDVSYPASGPAASIGVAFAVDAPAPATPNHALDSQLRPSFDLPDGRHSYHVRTCDARPSCGPESVANVFVDATAPGAPPLTSPSHPYGGGRSRNLSFTWGGLSGVVAYSRVLDHAPATVPAPTPMGTQTAASFPNIAPGDWWFHVRAENLAGTWGPTSHFEVRVLEDPDPSPPALPSPVMAPSRWFLTEGSTGPGFDTYVLLANPSGRSVTAHLTYLTPDGASPGPTVAVPPDGRTTVHVNDTVTDWSVSTSVDADGPLVVERSMYVSSGGRVGAGSGAGVAAPSKAWAFAEGSTGPGFETWLLLANPGAGTALVSLYLETSLQGGVQGPSFEVLPHSRRTLLLNNMVADYEVASTLTSDLPVYAERTTYVLPGGPRPPDVTGSVGATAGATDWLAAEGAASAGFETYILVMNAGLTPVSVRVSFETPQGVVAPSSLDGLLVTSGRRQTIRVNDYLTSDEVATRVHAESGAVVVERATYYDRPGLLGATSDKATSRLDTVWYSADGATASGFETFLLLANPDSTRDASVSLSFLTDRGLVSGPALVVARGTRVTIRESSLVGPTFNVSAVVSSTNGVPIALDRSTFDPRGAQGGQGISASRLLDAQGL